MSEAKVGPHPNFYYCFRPLTAPRAPSQKTPADRRPIDPPPIVQLRVTTPNDASGGLPPINADKEASAFLQNPYYFMFASLAAPDSDEELHLLKDGKTRYTTGSVVSSLYHLKDHENGGKDAGFFVFPDLSVRTEGSYRLKLSLFEVVGQVYLAVNPRMARALNLPLPPIVPRCITASPSFQSLSTSTQRKNSRAWKASRLPFPTGLLLRYQCACA